MKETGNTVNFTSLIKRYRVQFIAVAVFVAALVFLAAFSGNRAEPEPADLPAEEAVSVPAEEPAVYCEGFGLYVDGVFVAANADESVLTEAVAAAARERGIASQGDTECEYSFANAFSCEAGEYPEESFADKAGITAILCGGETNSLGEPLSVSLAVTSKKTYVVENVIEHGTVSW